MSGEQRAPISVHVPVCSRCHAKLYPGVPKVSRGKVWLCAACVYHEEQAKR